MPEPPHFRAAALRSPVDARLRGAFVDVALVPGGLRLVPGSGEKLEIPFDAIDRVRFGYETSRLGGRLYQMRIWTHRSRGPLVLLVAGRDTSPGYCAVARAAAAAVAERRGSVEGGLGWGRALFLLLLLLPFLVVGSWFSVRGLIEGAPLLFLVALPGAVLVVGGAFGYGFWRLWRPRRLEALAQIEPFVSKEARPWLF